MDSESSKPMEQSHPEGEMKDIYPIVSITSETSCKQMESTLVPDLTVPVKLANEEITVVPNELWGERVVPGQRKQMQDHGPGTYRANTDTSTFSALGDPLVNSNITQAESDPVHAHDQETAMTVVMATSGSGEPQTPMGETTKRVSPRLQQTDAASIDDTVESTTSKKMDVDEVPVGSFTASSSKPSTSKFRSTFVGSTETGAEHLSIAEKTIKRDRRKSSSISTSKKKAQKVKASPGPKSEETAVLSPKDDNQDVFNDSYCWVCHREGEVLCCEKCPRVFHTKCMNMAEEPEGDWFCPECVKVTEAECNDTKSRSMSMLTRDQFCLLLTHVIQRMKVPSSEPFHEPVDTEMLPDYVEYVFHPMDLSTMEGNIAKRKYGCPEAFLGDFKWVVHNCILYNTLQSKLTQVAKLMLKIAERELKEIELCPECYLNSCQKGENWFCEPCKELHPLVWAKLQGFPHWPAKVLRIEKNSVDVRFFGQHDRAWIPLSGCFMISKDLPLSIKSKKLKGGLDAAVLEMQQYVENVKKFVGEFEYAPLRTPFGQSDFFRESFRGKANLSSKLKEPSHEKMPSIAKMDKADSKGVANLEIEQHEKINKDAAGSAPAPKAKAEEGDSDSELVIDLGDVEESADGRASASAGKAGTVADTKKRRKSDAVPDAPATAKPVSKSILSSPKPSGKSEKKKMLAKVLSEKIGGKRKHETDTSPAASSSNMAKVRKTREQSLEKLNASPSDNGQKGPKSKEKDVKKSHYTGKYPEKEGSVKIKPGILKSSTDATAPRRDSFQGERRMSDPSKQKHKDLRDIMPKSILKKPSHSGDKPGRIPQIPTGADTRKLFNGGRIPRKAPAPDDEQERKENRGDDALMTDGNQSMDVRARGGDPPGLTPRSNPPRQGAAGKPSLQQKKGADQNLTFASLRKYSDRVMDTVQKVFYEMYTDMMAPLSTTNAGSEASATAMHEVAQMRLELERLKWMHRQEITELKSNHELALTEIRQNLENEKSQLVLNTMRKADAAKERAVEETKRKQWCACCGKEAMFFCCWNTSYCDYPCQQKHWPAHMAHCAQAKEALPPTADTPASAHQHSAHHLPMAPPQTGASTPLEAVGVAAVPYAEEGLRTASTVTRDKYDSSTELATTGVTFARTVKSSLSAVPVGRTRPSVTSAALSDIVVSHETNRAIVTALDEDLKSATTGVGLKATENNRPLKLSANMLPATSPGVKSSSLCAVVHDRITTEPSLTAGNVLASPAVQLQQIGTLSNEREKGESRQEHVAEHSLEALSASSEAEPVISTSHEIFSNAVSSTMEVGRPAFSTFLASKSTVLSESLSKSKDFAEAEDEKKKSLMQGDDVTVGYAGWPTLQSADPSLGNIFSPTTVTEAEAPGTVTDSILADEYLIDSAPVTEIEVDPFDSPAGGEELPLSVLPDSDDDNLILLESADEQMESDNDGGFMAP